MDIQRYLPNNQYQAALNANAPTGANPFATIADIGAHGLPQVLAIDNKMLDADRITSLDGKATLAMQNIAGSITWGTIGVTHTSTITVADGNAQLFVSNAAFSKNTNFGIFQNDTLQNFTAGATDQYPTIISTRGPILNANIVNSVAIAGVGLVLNKDNTLFTPHIQVQATKQITSTVGVAHLDMNADGVANSFSLATDAPGLYGEAYFYAHPTYVNVAHDKVLLTMGGGIGQLTSDYTSTIDYSRLTWSSIIAWNELIDVGTGNYGIFGMTNNINGSFLLPDIDNIPTHISARNCTIAQNVVNSVAVGGDSMIMKSNDTAYVNSVTFNTGFSGEMKLVHTPQDGFDYVATLQAKSGTIAYLSDIPAGAGDNIYNINGALTGARTITYGGNTLSLLGGNTIFDGFMIGQGAAGISLNFGTVSFTPGFFSGTLGPAAITGNHSWTLPNATGTVALKSVETYTITGAGVNRTLAYGTGTLNATRRALCTLIDDLTTSGALT